jgi:DNA invertase Pin-like site-specific DNA recombinase
MDSLNGSTDEKRGEKDDEGSHLCPSKHGEQRTRPNNADARALRVRRGWTVAGEYVDIGISGTKQKGPELDRLMADAHRRRMDVVAVWKFDRMARSVSHLLRALETFNSLKIEFVSLSESQSDCCSSGWCRCYAEAVIGD